MNKTEEAKLAWKTWNRLDELLQLLWDLYEERFLEFIREENLPQEKPSAIHDEPVSSWRLPTSCYENSRAPKAPVPS